MTDKPTPKEIENLFVEETGFDIDDFPAAIFDFARAVLAKWGTPAPVGVEPLSATQVSGLAESAGYWHGDMSRADFINGIRYAEAAHGIKGGQHGTE